jgi:hypothetical protein
VVARVHDHVGDAGAHADVEHLLPGAAAVERAVEAAVAAVLPQRALGGDEDTVGVRRVDEEKGLFFSSSFGLSASPFWARVGAAATAAARSRPAIFERCGTLAKLILRVDCGQARPRSAF